MTDEYNETIREALIGLDMMVAFFEVIDQYDEMPEFTKHKLQVAARQLDKISKLPVKYSTDDNVIFLEK